MASTTSSCFHVTQVEEIKRIVGEGLYEMEILGPDGQPSVSARGIDIVDPRDWAGFDILGNNDNSAILQAAIDEAAYKNRPDLGFGTSKRLMLPAGRIAFSSSLLLRKQLWMEGTWAASGGTELWFVDSAGQANSADHAITTPDSGGLGLSYVRLENLRIEDKRTASTAGRGLNLLDFDNGVLLHHLQVMQFPLEQIYVGAPSGYAGDCLDIYDVWVSATAALKPYAKGIYVERQDNFVSIRNIKSDIWTAPANDGYVIRVGGVPNDRAVVEINTVKHESKNRCPTISLPFNTRGNMTIRNINQQQPGSSDHTQAGDVVQFGSVAGGSAFAPDGTAMGWTTGSTSEIGGRCTLENITGENHSDWTGATGAATVRMLGSGTAAYGAVPRAAIGGSGRVFRELGGSVAPNGSVYGNTGDEYSLIGWGTADSPKWLKRSGNATNSGWAPVGTHMQAVAYAATINPNFNLGTRLNVAALTGNVAVQVPTYIPAASVDVQFDFTQDATGARTISWGSNFKGAWPTAAGAANQKLSVFGLSDGGNLIYVGSSGWYS